ncbi:MAG: AMP-binding protein, partial [Moritella sp.]|uniref:AMP-binding protein n=1 Tax=Moritella sp. TaxID=78556 RepID=UPI0029B1D492
MFFNDLRRFKDNIAIIDAASGRTITYANLDHQVGILTQQLGDNKELVFIESKNTIQSVVCYLACLKSNKVVYLADDFESEKSIQLINSYNPNLLINGLGQIYHHSQSSHSLHPNLTLLLSTSGTTGTPKFVKLSTDNIQSNTESIVEYLQLNEDDIALAHLKLHYSYGLSILHSHLQAGACTVFTAHSVLDAGFWHDLVTYSATSFAGVPYTFETLLKTDFDFKQYPTLRYVTQAGGKLEGYLVKEYALQAQANEVEFFVMYGQTEAAPRISYLPPHLTVDFPNTIGRAIPQGELTIVNEQGYEITALDKAGELVYRGRNVMMGYARCVADLAGDETPAMLLTGDIACRTQHDLFYLVGRTKRFVKLFGLRINLDDVQSFVKKLYPQSAVTGNDDAIIVALEATNEYVDSTLLLSQLTDYYALPHDKFIITPFNAIPLLSNGKYDFRAIAEDVYKKPTVGFIQRTLRSISNILELDEKEWESISDLFIEALSLHELS